MTEQQTRALEQLPGLTVVTETVADGVYLGALVRLHGELFVLSRSASSEVPLMVYVPRTSTAKRKLTGRHAAPLRTVTLDCGHATDAKPAVSNPDRWWCCGTWRRAR